MEEAASARRDGGGVSFPSPRPQTRAPDSLAAPNRFDAPGGLSYARRAVPAPTDKRRGRTEWQGFRLELEGGTPADPPTFETAVSTWRPGDTIPLGRSMLTVIGVRDDDADQPPVLVVEEA